MNFFDAVKSCFKNYFGFRGRAQRSEFWYWVLFLVIAGIVLGLLDSAVFNSPADDDGPFAMVFNVVTFIPGLAVAWRRLHDTNRSGWWIGGFYLGLLVLALLATLLSVVTQGGLLGVLLVIVGLGILGYIIMLIVFFCQDSHSGTNRFGDNPKGEGNYSVFD